MSNAKLIELVRRLALAENELEATRARVWSLLQHDRRRIRLRRRDGILALVALVLAFGLARSLDTLSHGKPQPLTVRAPFIVVDDQNKPIIKVDYMTKKVAGRNK